MNLRTLVSLAALVAPLAIGACGGGQSEATTPANPPASASASGSAAASAAPAESASAAPSASAAASASAPAAPPGPPGPGDWDKWTHDQKLAYMKSDVMPKMGALFTEFDAKKYAEPKCVLCHGSGAKDGSFTMPNPELPKLDITPAGFKKLQATHAKIAEFMMKKVEPTMAGLLGEQPFDPKTKQGFGCLGCHTAKEAKGAAAGKDATKPGAKGADSAGAAGSTKK